jgi:plastocyanin
MRRRVAFLVGVAALAALASMPTGIAAPAQQRANIDTIGRNGMRPNEIIFSTLRFQPGRVSVQSGGRVRLTHADQTTEPHTLSIVRRAELPRNSDEVFNCPVCGQIAGQHFGGEQPRLVVEDDQNAERGLDGRGDSMLVFDNQSLSRRVSAPAGRTLYFLCAIHPWMQGQINVR